MVAQRVAFCLHQLPMMWLMHDGMVIKLFLFGSCVFAQEHDFPTISQKTVRSCVSLTSKLMQFRPRTPHLGGHDMVRRVAPNGGRRRCGAGCVRVVLGAVSVRS